MPSVEFEPTISAGERPQTYALDRAATGTGYYFYINNSKHVVVNTRVWCVTVYSLRGYQLLITFLNPELKFGIQHFVNPVPTCLSFPKAYRNPTLIPDILALVIPLRLRTTKQVICLHCVCSFNIDYDKLKTCRRGRNPCQETVLEGRKRVIAHLKSKPSSMHMAYWRTVMSDQIQSDPFHVFACAIGFRSLLPRSELQSSP